MTKYLLIVAFSLSLTACTTPPQYIVAYESDYSDPKARQVLTRLVGPDDMRVRRSGSVVDRACAGETSAVQQVYRACESADGEIAEVQIYRLARVFFSLGDAHFADSLRLASDATKSFAARHLVPVLDHYHVHYPLTRRTLAPRSTA